MKPNPTQNTPRIQKMRRICTSTFITGRAEPPLTTVEPGARSRISAIFFAGRRNSAGSSGGCSSSGCGVVRTLLTTCAPSPRALKFWKTEAFRLRGLCPPRMERVWGVTSAARFGAVNSTACRNTFSVGRTRVCTTPISLHQDCLLYTSPSPRDRG